MQPFIIFGDQKSKILKHSLADLAGCLTKKNRLGVQSSFWQWNSFRMTALNLDSKCQEKVCEKEGSWESKYYFIFD